MKIAISGKGGTGKTTLAGVMARVLAARGEKVLAIDADPDANLASAIGVSPKALESLSPLAAMEEFIEERTASKKGAYGAFFKLNPRVDDIPERFSVTHEGVTLILLGSIPRGGGGCFCPESALLRSLLAHVFIERSEWVIVDMEAGLEHLGRGTTAYMDALIVVVEPGVRSFQTARQTRKLAADLGLERVYIVGNKAATEADKALIRGQMADLPVLGIMSHSEAIAEADRRGVSPFDLDPSVRREVEEILENLAPLSR